MSFLDNKRLSLFPLEWIKKCIETYTQEHGKEPKILVIAEDDYLDYAITATLSQANHLNVKVIRGDWLKSGEIDLAAGDKIQEDG